MEQNTSRYRIRTELPPFAGFAVLADPHVVELVHRLFHDFGLVGEDARLEVSLAIGFHTDTSAGEVRAADIDLLTVEDQHLEMHPRTKYPLQSVEKHRIFVEVLTEVRAGFLRVDEPYLHPAPYQLGNKREKRFLLLAHLHVKVLDVGGADPEGVLHGGHTGEDGGVVGGVGDVGEHKGLL